jgi:hypothetical protein
MRGTRVADWRTVQMFLSEDGVSEVQIDNESPQKVRCNCRKFVSYGKCKHSKHVKSTMDNNHGHYTVLVPEEIDEQIVLDSLDTPEGTRQFIIRHARVEVL